MSITIKKFLEKFKEMELLTSEETLNQKITEQDIVRPGLSMVEEIENFPYNRIQVYGTIEMDFLNRHNFNIEDKQRLVNSQIPIIIFARNLHPTQEFIQSAEKTGVCIVVSKMSTTKLVSRIHRYLERELAPMTTVHGVLLKVHGVGTLIKGKSGIGKSEVALDLIRNGHILVADDSVVIKKIDDVTLIGEAPVLLKNRLEIRGIGIVDIQKLYGVTSVSQESEVDVIIDLVDMDTSFDRIGNEILIEKILDNKVKKIQLPVTSGRSLAGLIEAAIANYQLKVDYNYDSSADFVKDLNKILLENGRKK